MIRMIGLDLDGTLLTRDKRLTKKNSEVLALAARRGIHIVPVTGRPLSGIPEAVEALPFIHSRSGGGASVHTLCDHLQRRCDNGQGKEQNDQRALHARREGAGDTQSR